MNKVLNIFEKVVLIVLAAIMVICMVIYSVSDLIRKISGSIINYIIKL